MLKLNVEITKDLLNRLNSSNKKIFSRAQEELTMNILLQIYNGNEPIKIILLSKNKNANIYCGDLIIVYLEHDDMVEFAEVKSSHVYITDRQTLELEHFEDEDMTKPKSQNKSTGNSKGWFYNSDSDYLACYNRQNQRMYFIWDWRNTKARLDKIIDDYLDGKQYKNLRKSERINDYLEFVKMKDSYKDKDFGYEIIKKWDACVTLDLEQLEKVSNDFDVFDLEFIID